MFDGVMSAAKPHELEIEANADADADALSKLPLSLKN